MRILANYGYKTNGDTYSVTFETMGDVPADHAPATVDTLFSLAREAVKRQIKDAAAPGQQPSVVVTVPRPQVAHALQDNGNGSHGPASVERKHTIKDPSLPASPKQVALLTRLAKERRVWLGELADLSMVEDSAKIDELMASRR